MSPYIKTIQEPLCWQRPCHHSLLLEANIMRPRQFGFTRRSSERMMLRYSSPIGRSRTGHHASGPALFMVYYQLAWSINYGSGKRGGCGEAEF